MLHEGISNDTFNTLQMWSSVRRYRGRSTRDDDLIISCSCITDWCFTWCGKQCSKKSQQRASVSSQQTTDSDQSEESKCCTFGGCFVQTTQVRGSDDQGSQVGLEETATESDPADWTVQQQVDKNDDNEEEVIDVGHWSYLRRFRPRFFNNGGADVSGINQVKQDSSKPSGFRRLSLWFRQLHQRAELSPDSAASPSAVVAVECPEEEIDATECDEVQNAQNEQNSSSWGKEPFFVFERGRCGYAAFNPNCCRLWETMEYSIAQTSPSSSRETKLPAGTKVLDEPKSLFENDILDNVKQNTSVTRITVASDLEHSQKKVLRTTSTENGGSFASSKQTQVHTPDTKDTGKEFMGIEKVDLARDIVNVVGSSSVQKDTCDSGPSAGTGHHINHTIPEVVISGAGTPTPKEETSPKVYQKVPSKSLPRQRAVDGEASNEVKQDPNHHHEPEKERVKVDILNYMIKSSPKKAPNRAVDKKAQDTSNEVPGFSDSKKSVRFKELPYTHSSTKGRAVYIGTSKHSSAPKREIFDCLSMTVERRCVTLQGANQAPTTPCVKPVVPPGGPVESPKGVKEYVNEYSELCKASVDQERQILQTVIDSVREYYKMPTALDNTASQQKENNQP